MKYLFWLLLIFSGVNNLHAQENGAHSPYVKPNVIRWGTASEHRNFGYDVYRGLSKEGPFEVANAEPIPGAGTTDMPKRYEFKDTSVLPNTVYWYYVESISLTGERKTCYAHLRVSVKV